jgi:hypothetical protein
MKKLLWPALVVISLASTSCGNSDNLYPVYGKVTYKGQPAAGAIVFFRRPSGASMNDHAIMGIVQDDGSFTLVCGSSVKGVPPGEYDVLIEWKQNLNQAKGLAQKGHDRLKGRYADPQHPQLHAVVRAETNNLDPFELTD